LTAALAPPVLAGLLALLCAFGALAILLAAFAALGSLPGLLAATRLARLLTFTGLLALAALRAILAGALMVARLLIPGPSGLTASGFLQLPAQPFGLRKRLLEARIAALVLAFAHGLLGFTQLIAEPVHALRHNRFAHHCVRSEPAPNRLGAPSHPRAQFILLHGAQSLA
jgi:hypothetical protein